ncbi:hypothetical protein [Nocardia goodfellowii]|uniref:Uncharacterized protein n=1 Tax=Nocardia goodfellowii TaxID=882446 RepID=A0ABS4QI26_9NOCA|nr:hypothetical protein [Nocardia goodfellowii]MBP2191358.1 hypothetical protein [Nocardia goodfellowii]
MKGIPHTALHALAAGSMISILVIGGSGMASADSNPVPVPPGYVPDGSSAVHDYCTSPMPNEYLGADFRGPCAKHDMCMEAHRRDQMYGSCHNQFSVDLQSVCNWAFSSTIDFHRRKSCNTYVDGVMLAVRRANP